MFSEIEGRCISLRFLQSCLRAWLIYNRRMPRLRTIFRDQKKRLVILTVLAVAGGYYFWQSGVISGWKLEQAKREVRADHLEAAEAAAMQAVAYHPESAQVHFLLARIYRLQRDLSQFERSLRKAVDLGLDRQLAMHEQLLAQAQSGNIDEVRPQLDQLMIGGVFDGNAILEAYVNGCLASAYLSDAQTLIDGWQVAFPELPQPYYYSGRLLMHYGRNEDARAEFLKVLDREPTHYGALYLSGQIEMLMNRPEAALERFRQLAEIPYWAAPRVGMAKALRSLGRVDEARKTLESVVEISAADIRKSYQRMGDRFEGAPAALELGSLELAVGNPERALVWLDQAVKANPSDLSARHAWGMALQGSGQREAARRELEAVREARAQLREVDRLADLVRDNPELVDERVRIGELYLKYESKLTGEFWLKTALMKDPNHPKAHLLLAQLYEERAQSEPVYRILAEQHGRLAGVDPEIQEPGADVRATGPE